MFALAATAVFHPLPATAQSYCGPQIPVSFNGANGQYPSGYLTIDSQGNVYGTTSDGTIWKYSPSAGLTTFSAPSGTTGLNRVVFDSQGNLWGSTSGGGIGGNGTIFELTTAGVFNTVFEFSGANGANPGPLVFDCG